MDCSDDGAWEAYLERSPVLAFFPEARPGGTHDRLGDVEAPPADAPCEVILSGVDGAGKYAVAEALTSADFRRTQTDIVPGVPTPRDGVYRPRPLAEFLAESLRGAPRRDLLVVSPTEDGHRVTATRVDPPDERPYFTRSYLYHCHSVLEPSLGGAFPEERLRGLVATFSRGPKIVAYLRTDPAASYERASPCLKKVYSREMHEERHRALERAWSPDNPRPHPVYVIDAEAHFAASGGAAPVEMARLIFAAVRASRA